MASPGMRPGQEQANQDACTGVATAMTIVSIVIVGLRVYTRTFVVRNFGKDDWAMLIALVFTIAYLIAIYVLRHAGMGFSGQVLTLEQMTTQVQTTLAIEIMYYFLVTAIKTSILFFYLRIAAARTLERLSKGTIYFLITFCVVCIIACLTQCIPLHKMWDFTGLVKGKCINTTALFYTTSAVNIVTDLWILALPIKTLMGIQRPNREKFALIFVFCLGVFSCIASIVRLHSIRIYTESPDPFYDSVPINLWSMVEVNIGIYCASIPSLKALFIRGQRDRSRSTSAYKYYSRDRSGHSKISGKMVGGSSSDGSRGTVNANEAYDLKNLDMSGSLQQPRQVARKHSTVDSERSSQERIFAPGADARV